MNSETRRAVALAAVVLSNCGVDETMLEGACWLAQDDDGEWFTYEEKPVCDTEPGQWVQTVVGCIGYGTPPKDFKQMVFKL